MEYGRFGSLDDFGFLGHAPETVQVPSPETAARGNPAPKPRVKPITAKRGRGQRSRQPAETRRPSLHAHRPDGANRGDEIYPVRPPPGSSSQHFGVPAPPGLLGAPGMLPPTASYDRIQPPLETGYEPGFWAAQNEEEYGGTVAVSGRGIRLGGRALLRRRIRLEHPAIIASHCENAALESTKKLLAPPKRSDKLHKDDGAVATRTVGYKDATMTGNPPFQPTRPAHSERIEPRHVATLLVWQQGTKCFVQTRLEWLVAASLPRSSANRSSVCFPSGNLVNVGSRRLMAGLVQGGAALIRDQVRSVQWLRTLRPSEAPVGRSVRQLASRAALDACCTSPLAFAGDKRGRMREVFAGIVNRIPSPLDTTALEFTAGPSAWSYEGSSKPNGAMIVMSARIALPDPACVVKLAFWLPAEIAQKFAMPETAGEEIGQRHVNLSMTEWRLVVR